MIKCWKVNFPICLYVCPSMRQYLALIPTQQISTVPKAPVYTPLAPKPKPAGSYHVLCNRATFVNLGPETIASRLHLCAPQSRA